MYAQVSLLYGLPPYPPTFGVVCSAPLNPMGPEIYIDCCFLVLSPQSLVLQSATQTLILFIFRFFIFRLFITPNHSPPPQPRRGDGRGRRGEL